MRKSVPKILLPLLTELSNKTIFFSDETAAFHLNGLMMFDTGVKKIHGRIIETVMQSAKVHVCFLMIP